MAVCLVLGCRNLEIRAPHAKLFVFWFPGFCTVALSLTCFFKHDNFRYCTSALLPPLDGNLMRLSLREFLW
jgi:hypothetical protein